MMTLDTPTLDEITRLTRQELTTSSRDDPIRECGRAALSLLLENPTICLELAYQKLHDVPYKDVKTCWRRLYTDASLWGVVFLAEKNTEEERGDRLTAGLRQAQVACGTKNGWIDEMVSKLDMALILAGAPRREELVERWFGALKSAIPSLEHTDTGASHEPIERPAKRRKVSRDTCVLRSFAAIFPEPKPTLRHPIQRLEYLRQSTFQKMVDDGATHNPIIIEGALPHWPALDERPWNNPEYLMEQTLGGRRLVPVEVGKSYTDEGWGQRIITFREFMEKYMVDRCPHDEADPDDPDELLNGNVPQNSSSQRPSKNTPSQTGYLAQHDLFAQIPSLRADIAIPEYCFCEPAPSPHLTHIKIVDQLEEPILNAWFGPVGTVSPLHTDPYHNILAQVVGYKYIRLYDPRDTPLLYPRNVDENGVDMSNTSQVDLDEAMANFPEISCWERSSAEMSGESGGWEEVLRRRRAFENQYRGFKGARYLEGVLGPGECLYIPVGWWHYVRSLTPSFSVSFWFN